MTRLVLWELQFGDSFISSSLLLLLLAFFLIVLSCLVLCRSVIGEYTDSDARVVIAILWITCQSLQSLFGPSVNPLQPLYKVLYLIFQVDGPKIESNDKSPVAVSAVASVVSPVIPSPPVKTENQTNPSKKQQQQGQQQKQSQPAVKQQEGNQTKKNKKSKKDD